MASDRSTEEVIAALFAESQAVRVAVRRLASGPATDGGDDGARRLRGVAGFGDVAAVDSVLHRLVSYLDAHALHSLRRVNKRLYNETFEEPPPLFRTSLFDHQKESLRFVLWKERELGGCLLCDEPGLGKTAVVLALIASTKGMIAKPVSREEEEEEEEDVDDVEQDEGEDDRHENDHFYSRALEWTKTHTSKAVVASPSTSSSSSKTSSHRKLRLTPKRQRIVAEYRRLISLPCTCTTLVIAPHTLIPHWRAEMAAHWRRGGVNASRGFKVVEVVDSSSAFPDDLADGKYDVIMTTPARVSAEAKRGTEFTSLTSVRFLRVVIDEGQFLGGSGVSNYAQLLRIVRCERRVVMTGTPSKLQTVRGAMRALGEMLDFVGSPRPSPSTSSSSSSSPPQLLYSSLVSRLSEAMVRHEKRSVRIGLPRLRRETTALRMSPLETRTYNMIVAHVRANILLTAIGNEGASLSLLDPSRRRLAREVVDNVRRACCAVGEMRISLSDENLNDTRMMMEAEGDAEATARVEEFCRRAPLGLDSECGSCGRRLPFHFVTSCGHFICVQCFIPNVTATCPTCAKPFEGNAFAALQPGFSLDWREVPQNGGEELSEKVRYILTSKLKMRDDGVEREKPAAPNSTIEISNEVKPDETGAAPDEKTVIFSQFRSVLNLVGDQLLRALGSDAVAEYYGKWREMELDKFANNRVAQWGCAVCGGLNDWDAGSVRCNWPSKCKVLFDGEAEEKEIGNPLAALTVERETGAEGLPALSRARTPDELLPGGGGKVRAVRIRTGTESEARGVVVGHTPCPGTRSREASPTQHRPAMCRVLLLGRDGSLGLNLNMASRIIMLDPVWDPALENQIVSRAWRLGNNSREVCVEQLVYKDTIEEELMTEGGGDGSVNTLLRRLRLVD